jgi:hypothetical protein
MSPFLKRRFVAGSVRRPLFKADRESPQNATAEKTSSATPCGTTILLSAFLMFQVQLVLAKFVLPRFGGGPSVWSTSLLVFQLLLLAGYGYAAVVCSKLPPRLQGKLHLFLLAGSAAVIVVLTTFWHSPILPPRSWKAQGEANPVWQIASLLLTAVGFHCALLSATSPLLQRWISDRTPGATPYRLYALSNLGSMLGLLSYPFLIERFLTLSTQAWVWAVGYGVFLLGAGGCAVLQMQVTLAPVEIARRKRKQTPGPRLKFLWLALAACASTMLLATTNLICQQVAVIPLLWVLPLSFYLLSFIICFDHARWYRREIFHPLYVALALLSLKTMPSYSHVLVAQLLLIFCSTMLVVCMVCHGELARLKPEPQYLTSFYLMSSTGGALGSAFVVILAPRIFERFWEFQIALLGCGILVVLTLVRDRNSWLHQFHYGWVVLSLVSVLMVGGSYVFTKNLQQYEGEGSLVAWRTRNFFGVKTVLRMPEGMFLVHGHTLHGRQNSDPATRNEPTSYYVRQSGVGLLLDHYPRPTSRPNLRVGVIGMGAGTLAAYGQPGDYFRFYEIDPAIAGLSLGSDHLMFTFLQSSPASSDIVLGDARLTMQDELARGDSQQFDILVVDAFSGDAIPVHLLTREAIQIYLRQLRGPESVLALHITNTALDLRPVADAISRDYRLNSLEVYLPQGDRPLWVLASKDASMLLSPVLANAGKPIQAIRSVKPWTDDYSNLYDLIRTRTAH